MRSSFKFLRAVAILAILCTLAVLIFMLVEAATPADKSAALSGKFSGENGGQLVVSGRGDKIPTTGLSLRYGTNYSGMITKPNLTFIPAESTDREVIWEVVNENNPSDNGEHCITLNTNNGELTNLHLGTLTVRVSLKSDPSINTICTASCLGTDPAKITDLSLTKTSFLQGEICALRLADQDGELISIVGLTLQYSDGGEHFVVENNLACPKKPGTSTITVGHKNMSRSYSYDVTIEENPNYIPLDDIVPNESVVPDGQTFFVKPNVQTDFRQIITCLPKGSSNFQSYIYSIQNPEGKSVIENDGTYFIKSVATGEAKLTITSLMDPTKSITLNIRVYIDKPTSLQIITSDIFVVDNPHPIKTFGGEYYIDDVTYTVVKGKAKIENGAITPTRLGKLVIRATYDDDPSLYTELTIDVKLFSTFASFIRKALGHFALFAVLGFGFSYVYLFLFEQRFKWIAAPIALPTGLLLAMASEGLQLTAEGRYGSWTDVGVDFVGFALGICVAWLVLGVIFFVAKLVKKYRPLKDGFDAVSAKTLFSPADKLTFGDGDVAKDGEASPKSDESTIEDHTDAKN